MRKVSYGAHAADGGETNMGLPAIETDDSAMAGAFFATLECELLGRRRFHSQAKARIAAVHFIEGFCNPTRRHSALGYLSPIESEARNMLMKD